MSKLTAEIDTRASDLKVIDEMIAIEEKRSQLFVSILQATKRQYDSVLKMQQLIHESEILSLQETISDLQYKLDMACDGETEPNDRHSKSRTHDSTWYTRVRAY